MVSEEYSIDAYKAKSKVLILVVVEDGLGDMIENVYQMKLALS